MDFICIDAPPPEIYFELAENDDPGSEYFEVVKDEDYCDAREASADLREIGLRRVSPAMGWRAWRSAREAFEAYREARSAADVGGPEAAQALKAAGSRLLEAAAAALMGFPGWDEAMEEHE